MAKKHKILAHEQLQNAEEISIWGHFVIVQQSLNNIGIEQHINFSKTLTDAIVQQYHQE